jgi:hypothetical protein
MFSSFVKGAPLIMPDGRLLVYVNAPDIAQGGILCRQNFYGPVIVKELIDEKQMQRGGVSEISFGLRLDTKQKPLFVFLEGSWPTNDGGMRVDLYAIPFEAARGTAAWSGPALATGHGALDSRLAEVREELQRMNRWSFDSDFWDNRTAGDHAYGLQRLSPSYLGLTSEPANVFRKG